MKTRIWLLSLLVGWSLGLQGLDLEGLKTRANYLSQDLAATCNYLLVSPENVASYELYLQQLFNWPYGSITPTPWSFKKNLIDQFKANYCQNAAHESDGVARGLKNVIEATSRISAIKLDLSDNLDHNNIAFLETLLEALGLSYANFSQMQVLAKQAELVNLLSFGPRVALSSAPFTTTITAPNPAGLAHGGAGGQAIVLPPVEPIRPGAAWLNAAKTPPVWYGGLPALGIKKSFCLLDDLDLNKVQLSKFPVVGKYMKGYPLADINVIIRNNLVDESLLRLVPGSIRTAIPAGYQTDFYTEISSWDSVNADGEHFVAKGNQFNLLFHGTMMNWFAAEYRTFNFDTDSATKTFDMGIFNDDGIMAVSGMGKGSLVSTDVNPHTNAYSPDNARFKVAPGRNIITWWSVAMSKPAKRAIVTYHVLINQEAYPGLVTNLAAATKRARNIADLMTGLNALPNVGGADGAAWAQAVRFLSELYRA